MKATITDVAERANVSIKTVSRVLNNEPNVAAATRERVKSVCKDLRYSPNLAARGLASSKTYFLALMYYNASPNYLTNIQQGAIEACRENGYHLVVEPFDLMGPDMAVDMEMLLDRMPVDGVILTPPLVDDPVILDILRRFDKNYVLVAPSNPPVDALSVKMDDTQAAYEMTQYLLRNGYKDIGFVKGHPQHGASDMRYIGFSKALEEAGMALRPEWIKTGDFTFPSGVAAAEEIFASPEHPRAIFASNDDMAAGVVSVAKRRSIAIPQKLAVCGFDDTVLAVTISPRLTTIKQPIHEMGYRAAKLLIDKSRANAHANDKNEGGNVFNLSHELIVRESSE